MGNAGVDPGDDGCFEDLVASTHLMKQCTPTTLSGDQ
jgi:hypothetical protein